MKKFDISWRTLLVGLLWFGATTYYFIAYHNGTLSGSIRVPIIISWVYDLFGFTAGTIAQWIFSLILIAVSIRRVKVDEYSDSVNDDDE